MSSCLFLGQIKANQLIKYAYQKTQRYDTCVQLSWIFPIEAKPDAAHILAGLSIFYKYLYICERCEHKNCFGYVKK